jgi:hypothetical protein
MSFALWLTLHVVIGFPLAIIVGNFGEWAIHKNLLHGRGKRKGHFFNFHYYDHHAEARKNGMVDPAYRSGWLGGGWNSRTKEATSLIVGSIPWFVLMPFAPGFAAGSLYTTWNYYWVHKKAHLDPEWARENVPWHYDHHMGEQEANWGVTHPWFDDLLGTRVKFVGTEQEAATRGRSKRPRTAPAARQAETPVEA